MQVAGIVQKLPAQAAAEILFKEKKGRLTARLHLCFSTLEHYDQPRREAVHSVAEKFKVIKKRLGMSFSQSQQSHGPGEIAR